MEASHKIKLKKYNIYDYLAKCCLMMNPKHICILLSRQTKSTRIFFNNDMVGGFELTEFLLD